MSVVGGCRWLLKVVSLAVYGGVVFSSGMGNWPLGMCVDMGFKFICPFPMKIIFQAFEVGPA